MAVTAEKYIEQAARGERLSATQRRHAVEWLKFNKPELTNFELGEMFHVSPRQIRLDKAALKKRDAQELAEDDIGLIVVDIRESITNQIIALERSKKQCRGGSREFLEHCKAIAELELKMTRALQDLGFYPKDLGTMSVKNYHFEAKVGLGGHTEVHQVRDVNPDSNREFEPGYQEPDEQIADAEFEDIPPKQLNDGNDTTDTQSTSGSDDEEISIEELDPDAQETSRTDEGDAGSTTSAPETA